MFYVIFLLWAFLAAGSSRSAFFTEFCNLERSTLGEYWLRRLIDVSWSFFFESLDWARPYLRLKVLWLCSYDGSSDGLLSKGFEILLYSFSSHNVFKYITLWFFLSDCFSKLLLAFRTFCKCWFPWCYLLKLAWNLLEFPQVEVRTMLTRVLDERAGETCPLLFSLLLLFCEILERVWPWWVGDGFACGILTFMLGSLATCWFWISIGWEATQPPVFRCSLGWYPPVLSLFRDRWCEGSTDSFCWAPPRDVFRVGLITGWSS